MTALTLSENDGGITIYICDSGRARHHSGLRFAKALKGYGLW